VTRAGKNEKNQASSEPDVRRNSPNVKLYIVKKAMVMDPGFFIIKKCWQKMLEMKK